MMAIIRRFKYLIATPILLALLTTIILSLHHDTPTVEGHPLEKVIVLPLKLETLVPGELYPYYYYTKLRISSPTQPFRVLVDIGLNDTFVGKFSRRPQAAASFRRGYLGDSSSTLGDVSLKPSEVSYRFWPANSTVNATKYSDTTKLAWSKPETHLDLDFLGVEPVRGINISVSPLDGSLALYSMTGRGHTDGKGQLVRALKAQNKIESEIFGLWLAKYSVDSPRQSHDPALGELSIGAINSSRYEMGTAKFHDLVDDSGWTLEVNQIKVNSSVLSRKAGERNCRVRLATDTNYIIGPWRDVFRIYLAAEFDNQDQFSYPCSLLDKMPAINFTIGSHDYTLPRDSYVKRLTKRQEYNHYSYQYDSPPSNVQCHLTLVPSADQGADCEWVLGTDFLMNYYTIFDGARKQIGFADLTGPSRD